MAHSIAPSLLAADFGKLNEAISEVNKSSASLLHLDVMDGQFVPNISFGIPVIEAVAKVSTKPLDIHLMIVDPDDIDTDRAAHERRNDCEAIQSRFDVHHETGAHRARKT